MVPEQENLLDTSEISNEDGTGMVAVDHGRIFVPAGWITPEALKKALREEHTPEKYPGFYIVFETVKRRTVQVLITPVGQIGTYEKLKRERELQNTTE